MQAKEQLKRAQNWMKTFGELNPEGMEHFRKLMGAVEKEDVLSAKTKELMAIAISITQQCEWCIAFHVNNALEEGATEEEVMEAAWVAVLMGGGPALMHAGLVLEALDEMA
ncbi:carboxymuconolactone decarboxylase family protein [Candidatus Bipolaricaulota bacterium]|nr:carboxymuconolactone decarboxylase family protein [Candidatus Bipolaricaulota bacterium]